MRYGDHDVRHRRQHRHRRAGAGGRGAGLRLAVAARAHPHPDEPHARRRRRGDAELGRGVQALPRPARGAGRRRVGHHHAAARHRDPARRPARADRDRQGGRDARPPQRRAGRARRRLRVERGRARATTASTMRDRRDVAREHVLAMQALWADDEASFDGEHVRVLAELVVAQAGAARRRRSPRVPVLHGGAAGPKLFAHIAEYGDGWIPIGGAGLTDAIPRLREAVGEAGRDPDGLEIVPVRLDPRPRQARPLRAHRRHRVRLPASQRAPRRRPPHPRRAGHGSSPDRLAAVRSHPER